jgi:hypothetical protein
MSNRIIRTKHGKYGYYAVRCPLNLISMADKAGYVVESRLLMALYMGRALYKNELVLHKDRNPANNEISNLRVVRKRCRK